MKTIITGATGMLGQGVLMECLDRPDISAVLVIGRRPQNIKHPKLDELVVKDFFALGKTESSLRGYDACLFCLGTSSLGKNEERYRKVTYDLTINFASKFLQVNPDSSFCYISGAGTDSSEKGKMMWARVKGKTENDLLAMPFKHVHVFRPGYVQPLRGIKSRTTWYNGLYQIFGWLYPLLSNLPKYVTDTSQLAIAMIEAAKNGHAKGVLESIDINMVKRSI